MHSSAARSPVHRDRLRAADMDSTDEQQGVAASWAPSSFVGILGLSREQWSFFLHLLNNQKNANPAFDNLSGKIENEWILDSGCSHQMTGRNFFIRY